MITAVLALPLFASAGMALDYSNFINVRNSVQSALDASGLATGAEFVQGADSALALEAYAEDFFEANIPDNIDSSQYQFAFQFLPAGSEDGDENESRLQITATVNYDTYFGEILGVQTLTEQLTSIISLGNRTVEVALVLDNSGSMGGNRITTLRAESKKLVDTIFNSSNLIDIERPVQFSLVPFAGTVNIGAGNANAAWMDRRGWSPVHHENFDWQNTYRTNNNTRARTTDGLTRDFQERVNGRWEDRTRFTLFDMLNEPWAGCVEMRPYPHNILDTAADSFRNYRPTRDSHDADNDGVGDGTSALFVPYFAPDEPDEDFAENDSFSNGSTPPVVNLSSDNQLSNNGSGVPVDFDSDDDRYRNNYLYDFIDYNLSNNPIDFSDRVQLFTDLDTQNDSDYDYPNHAHRPAVNGQNPTSATVNPQRGSQNQVNRTNWIFKYQIGELRDDNNNSSQLGTGRGPNAGCTTNPITELTEDRDEIVTALNAMQASGTTNIQQGLTWGWRSLTAAEPFIGGRAKSNENDQSNLKIIILLTDGNNFYRTDGDTTPNNTAYGAWGYARLDTHPLVNANSGEATHNRWLEGLETNDLVDTIYQGTSFSNNPNQGGEFEVIMNAHTNQACRNIKNDGISIYSVAFSVPSSGGVRDLMEACAGSGLKDDGSNIISNSQFFFDVNSNELDDAFEDIARQIANLRISG